MVFNYKAPAHLFAALLVAISLLVFVVFPLLSYVGVMNADATMEQMSQFPQELIAVMEVMLLLVQVIFVVFFFIIVPIVWYILVNNFTREQIIVKLQLSLSGIDKAVLWGVLTAVGAFCLMIAMTFVVQLFGVNVEDAGNIQDLERYFSLPAILILSTFQPIAEEIFFRGFLLEKLSSRFGTTVALFGTSALFGIAHLAGGNVIPALVTGLIGVLLAFVVLKTKSLYASIVAHILFNVTSVVLYIIGKSIATEALML